MEIEKERTDNVYSNIIDENIYNTLNINLPENKNNNLNEFIIKSFPNEIYLKMNILQKKYLYQINL